MSLASLPQPNPMDFGPLDALVGYQLRRAFLQSNQMFARMAGEAGLAPGQYGVLKLIELNPRRSQSEIAAAAGLDRSSLTQLLDQLVRRDLVERQPGPDRRTVSLVLTAEGAAVLQAAAAPVAEHEALVRRNLSKAEAAVLLDLLRRLQADPPPP